MKFSRVSKLDGIRSWSLEAVSTCPGAQAKDGSLVDACKGCYASGGFYKMKAAREARNHNRDDWKRADWVDDMVQELDNDRYFRWFDSGDIYHPDLASKILEVCKQTPWVKHWIPTRSHKLKKIRPILEELKMLENVSVRYSSDSISGHYDQEHGSTIIPSLNFDDPNLMMCEASKNDGKCNRCRACWDKTIPVIAYPAHGKKMIKLISS